MRAHVALLLIGLCALLVTPASAEKTGIQVKNPWVRQAFSGARVMAGYMVLKNMSKRPVVLVDVSCKDFKSVMMHRTVVQDGMARMQHQQKIRIAPGKGIEFKPGGYHLMLMHAKKTFRAGDKVNITLHYRDGRRQTVRFKIVQGAKKSHHRH